MPSRISAQNALLASHRNTFQQLQSYFLRAGILFAGGLSTCPTELFYMHGHGLSSFSVIDENLRGTARNAFRSLPLEAQKYYTERAAQNKHIRTAIGLEQRFNSKDFYEFVRSGLPQQFPVTDAMRSLQRYLSFRKAFTETWGARNHAQCRLTRPQCFDAPVLSEAIDKMLERLSLKINACRSFTGLFLSHNQRDNRALARQIEFTPDEKCTIHELVSIAFHVRRMVGVIPSKRTAKSVFESYKKAVLKNPKTPLIEFRNVVQAHAFLENYSNYLNALRYWQLLRVKESLCG